MMRQLEHDGTGGRLSHGVPVDRIASPSRGAPPTRGDLWAILLVASISAGVCLRLYQIDLQVIIDDEWHALYTLLQSDYAKIASGFGYADYSIPLTLLFRFMLLHGGLNELRMHVPAVVAGCALLPIAAFTLRSDTTAQERATLVALLAISPLLIYHARVARPYAFTCPLTLVALIAFRDWWYQRRNAPVSALAYLCATSLAGWLHLITLTFTTLPFAYYGVAALMASRQSAARKVSALLRLAALAVPTLLFLGIFLAAPLVNDWQNLSAKAATDAISLSSSARTLMMVSGTGIGPVAVVLMTVASFGAWRLYERNRDLGLFILVVIFVPAIAIALVKPAWIKHPGVYARYLLPALPFTLLLISAGWVGIVTLLSPRPAVQASLTGGAIVLLFLQGPIPPMLYWPNQFLGHLRFQFDYDPSHNPYVQQIPRMPIPEFYRDLARQPPGSITLLEGPWRLESHFNPYPWYQEAHRQFMKVVFVNGVCGERLYGEYPKSATGMHMRNFVFLSDILSHQTNEGNYLVMHLHPWTTPPNQPIDWPDIAACLAQAESALGKPVYRDKQIVVFGLKPEESTSKLQFSSRSISVLGSVQ